jgi:hypothetical protein
MSKDTNKKTNRKINMRSVIVAFASGDKTELKTEMKRFVKGDKLKDSLFDFFVKNLSLVGAYGWYMDSMDNFPILFHKDKPREEREKLFRDIPTVVVE